MPNDLWNIVPGGTFTVFSGHHADSGIGPASGATSIPGQPALTPLFAAIGPLVNAAVGLGIPGNRVVVAWSMLTQSIPDVLDVVSPILVG